MYQRKVSVRTYGKSDDQRDNQEVNLLVVPGSALVHEYELRIQGDGGGVEQRQHATESIQPSSYERAHKAIR